jgi:hypothetical protein
MAWKTVLVIKGRRAAVFDQLCHGHDRAVIKAILGQSRKDWVNPVEPFDDGIAGPIQFCPVAHKALEKVVMRVHQTGVDEHPFAIDDFNTLKRAPAQARPDGRDSAVFAQDILAPKNRIMGGCDDSRAVFE